MASKASVMLAGLAAGLLAFTAAAPAGTLDIVRKRGALVCGVSTGLMGFSDRDAAGNWSGFDVDFCRALAAAVLGDPGKTSFTPLSAADRFEALRSGKIDVLARNSTWTLEREARLGLVFAGVAYHDGQGFMTMRRPNATSALELGAASVCVQKETTSQANLADFFRANSMAHKEVAVDSPADAVKALEGGQCDVFSADMSALYAERLKLAKPAAATILPDVISKEPLGPAVRNDDIAWLNVVKWVNFALVNAEELGISSATAAEAMKSTKPDVRRFVGHEGGLGESLHLDRDWAIRAVRAVGNYGEMFERNVGSKSSLAIPRGLNQLWSMGGILYAPPLR